MLLSADTSFPRTQVREPRPAFVSSIAGQDFVFCYRTYFKSTFFCIIEIRERFATLGVFVKAASDTS
jgi:hypothetical protein